MIVRVRIGDAEADHHLVEEFRLGQRQRRARSK